MEEIQQHYKINQIILQMKSKIGIIIKIKIRIGIKMKWIGTISIEKSINNRYLK